MIVLSTINQISINSHRSAISNVPFQSNLFETMKPIVSFNQIDFPNCLSVWEFATCNNRLRVSVGKLIQWNPVEWFNSANSIEGKKIWFDSPPAEFASHGGRFGRWWRSLWCSTSKTRNLWLKKKLLADYPTIITSLSRPSYERMIQITAEIETPKHQPAKTQRVNESIDYW